MISPPRYRTMISALIILTPTIAIGSEIPEEVFSENTVGLVRLDVANLDIEAQQRAFAYLNQNILIDGELEKELSLWPERLRRAREIGITSFVEVYRLTSVVKPEDLLFDKPEFEAVYLIERAGNATIEDIRNALQEPLNAVLSGLKSHDSPDRRWLILHSPKSLPASPSRVRAQLFNGLLKKAENRCEPITMIVAPHESEFRQQAFFAVLESPSAFMLLSRIPVFRLDLPFFSPAGMWARLGADEQLLCVDWVLCQVTSELPPVAHVTLHVPDDACESQARYCLEVWNRDLKTLLRFGYAESSATDIEVTAEPASETGRSLFATARLSPGVVLAIGGESGRGTCGRNSNSLSSGLRTDIFERP